MLNNEKGSYEEASRMSLVLRQWIEESQNVVVFTGAGMSTDSGIPDFRSPGGIWTRMAPIMFEDFLASETTRIEAWKRKFAMDDELGEVAPNAGHEVIATLVEMGKVSHVITQNIDNLHQRSGIDESKIIELHGNNTYAKCLDCDLRHELASLREAFFASQQSQAPGCQNCGGMVKSATISFGQAMPEREMQRAEAATLSCDLFLAIGSSLQVFPAAGFPIMARHNGARLVILTRDPTELDDAASLVLNEEITPTLLSLVSLDS
jgi:NAD-dependent deacetylase